MRDAWLEKEILNFISSVFDHDLIKVVDWFQRSNPFLENLSPVEMLKSGKGKDLYEFIIRQVY